VCTRASQFLRDQRERLSTVDQDIDSVPRPHRRITGRPTPGRRLERPRPSDPSEATLMMTADLPRDLTAEPILH
jgi:hypothetical protein